MSPRILVTLPLPCGHGRPASARSSADFRQPFRPPDPGAPTALRRAKGGSRQMNSTVILLAFALLAATFGCQSAKDKTVPDALVGVWKTPAQKYADRFFEITADKVVFAIGGGKTDSHPIVEIDTLREEAKILYTITYLTAEAKKYKFSFYHDPANGGVIRFKNQQHIAWAKGGR